MSFVIPALRYEESALAPAISAQTIAYHYGKHLAGYINNTNKLIEGTAFEGKSLEEIVRAADGGLFNNAAQVWNHIFYFESFTPKKGSVPSMALKENIIKTWGSFEQFKDEFVKVGVSQFGSGWVWLIKEADGSLSIISTPNAHTPAQDATLTPLLTFDVWEHAYYLDYQNKRPDALNALWDIVDWDVVSKRYE